MYTKQAVSAFKYLTATSLGAIKALPEQSDDLKKLVEVLEIIQEEANKPDEDRMWQRIWASAETLNAYNIVVGF